MKKRKIQQHSCAVFKGLINLLNYVFTRDFKKFDTISNVNPEAKYNWITSDLLIYKDSLGNKCEGILYKPTNFDVNKKYSVLFDIYQERASEKNLFLGPEPGPSGINVPQLVNKGFLVFRPDVYFEKAKFGPTALQSVLAGAEALEKYCWVDKTKFCLYGTSLAGLEVNYILTKTKRFTAAISVAGLSSAINAYNDLWDTSDAHIAFTGFMGGRFEDITQAYIDNSPIIFANNIQTPLLLLHNAKDNACAFYHSSQFFVQLRGLNKKVWLINYPDEMHSVINDESRLDLQKKVSGFLDYYLKGEPIPTWMNNPIKLN